MTAFRLSASITNATLLILCLPAAAEDASPRHGLSGSIGAAVAYLPTYAGSPNYYTALGPDLELTYRTQHWGHIDLGGNGAPGLSWNFEQGSLWGGVLLGVDPGRKEEKPSVAGQIPGDERLRGMGTIKLRAQPGVTVGYGPVGLTYLESIGHGGHSSQFNLALMQALPLSDRFTLSLSAGATWSDRNYMQTYFGVTAQQSAASGFAVYTPKAGLQRVDVGVGAEFKLSASLKLKTQLGGSRLCRIAERSPIVAKPTSGVVSVGLSYVF